MEKINSEIIFADKKLKKKFECLKYSKNEDEELYINLSDVFSALEKDAFAGVQIPKRLIPKDYKKRFGEIDNLWKYNLPNAWRLIYTIKRDKVIVLSIILEWMNHKDYEKRLKY